jgi:hypothetical protein
LGPRCLEEALGAEARCGLSRKAGLGPGALGAEARSAGSGAYRAEEARSAGPGPNPKPAGAPATPTAQAAAPEKPASPGQPGAAAPRTAEAARPAKPRPQAPAASSGAQKAPAAARPRPPAQATAAELSEERIRALHGKLNELKKLNREQGQVSLDGLARSLRATQQKLLEKHAGRRIDFDVVIKDGKAVVKPIVR